LLVSPPAVMLPPHTVVPRGERIVSDASSVIDDLAWESEELDRLVAPLDEARWALATPAPGWTLAHQIAHLAWTDRAALLAVTDAEAFAEEARKALASPATWVDEAAGEGAALPPARLLAEWRGGRLALEEALRAAPSGVRFAWYGPPMSTAS